MRKVLLIVSLMATVGVAYSPHSYSAVGSSRFSKQAIDSLDFRMKRRMGIGASMAGPLGLAGISLDLNLFPKYSFTAGYGFGGGFKAFHFELRRLLSGTSLVPFFNFGYAHWTNFGGSEPIESTNPTYLFDRFLSEDEKLSGKISEPLIYPGIGLQYFQLKGPWSGISFTVQLVMLVDVLDFEAAPTGSVGIYYYF